ncbi:glycosyltransferase [Fructilactobacillus sp. Tb1]|uniref:glycosyltransferase n=1 Tax=Fructilactobacillus sp. Tb1 TaxID=3422304 RepID=UPI003D276704
MKKISIVGPVPDHDGISTVLSHVLNDKKFKKEFKIEMFLYRRPTNRDFLDNFQKKFKINFSKKTNSIGWTLDFINYLIKFSGNAVIILSPLQVATAHFVKKIFRKKYKIISWMHKSSTDPGLGKKFKFLKYADYNLAISNGIKNELNNIGISDDKIGVIYNPVSKKKRTIYPNNKHCEFVYVGRIVLDGQKNLRGLLNCLSSIDGNWIFNIYGSGDDLSELKEIVNSNDILNQHVRVNGWIDKPFEKIKTANALLLNSNFEGFPMTLAEAISYGIPCISTDCPTGPSDIIKDGVNGYLYEIGNYTELTDILVKFVSRKVDFNTESIKKSIDFIYEDRYDQILLDKLKSNI